jgi:tellurite resistance protein
MRLIGPADVRIARPAVRTIHEHRDDDAKTGRRQAAGELRFVGHARRQAEELLGRLVGVRQGHDLGQRFAQRFHP